MVNTIDDDHPQLVIRTTETSPHSTGSEFATNSPASAPVTAQVSGQAAPVKPRSLARTHLAQTITTLDSNCDATSATGIQKTYIFHDAITMEKRNAEECASTQASSQIAPSLLIPPTAGRDSHDGPQLQPHSDITPHQSPAEVLTSSDMSSAAEFVKSGSVLWSPVVDIDSPMESQPRFESQTRKDLSPTQDVNMDSQQPDDIHMESQSEEMSLDHITPATPSSAQDQNPKMRTPSPKIIPQTENMTAKDTALEDKPPLLSPATTAPASDRAPSPFEGLLQNNRHAKQEHYRRAQIFTKTRETLRCKSRMMFLIASRGFERGLLPTKRTNPRLLKRRYSIDANAKDWGKRWPAGWEPEDELDFQREGPKSNHLNPLPILGTSTYPPTPSRYLTFGRRINRSPPFNEEIYLELGNATIRNAAFWFIGVVDYSWGSEVWMRDESIDMALEVLSRDLDCDAHGIDIANSTIAQICHFAAMTEDGSTREYDEYRERFKGKKWIFLVINDVIGGAINDGTHGSHWSLVAVDRQRKTAHYYDSLFINNSFHCKMGSQIALGLLLILGEDHTQWNYIPEYDSPNQNWHNQFNGDHGACGPFLLKMTEVLIQKIQRHQQDDTEHQCSLELDRDFPYWFKSQFNSLDVRGFIQTRIAYWKALVEAPRLIDEHDQQAIHDTDVTLVNEPVATILMPSRRLPSVHRDSSCSSRSSHRRRSRSTSNSYVDVELSDDDNVTIIRSTSRSSQVHEKADPFEEDDIHTWLESDSEEGERDSAMGDDDDARQNGGITLIAVQDDVDDDNDSNVTEVPENWEDEDEEDDHAAVRRIA